MIFSPIFKYEISFCFIDEDVLHQISQASCILMHCVCFLYWSLVHYRGSFEVLDAPNLNTDCWNEWDPNRAEKIQRIHIDNPN